MTYSEGKIYKLVFPKTNDIYVGSTTQTLCKRLNGHRCYPHGKVKEIMKLINPYNVKIILLENVSYENKDELRRYEQKWIDELNPFYNSINSHSKSANNNKRNNINQLIKQNIKYNIKQNCKYCNNYKYSDIKQHVNTQVHKKKCIVV